LKKGFDAVKGKYLSLLGATIIFFLIVMAASMVIGIIEAAIQTSFINTLVSVIISMILMLYVPSIMLNKKSAIDSLKESYNIFMKNKVEVILFWILSTVINLVILGIALIPVVIALLPVISSVIQMFAANDITMLPSIFMSVQQSIPLLAVAGVISAAIIAYMSVFQEAAKTFFYISVKKK